MPEIDAHVLECIVANSRAESLSGPLRHLPPLHPPHAGRPAARAASKALREACDAQAISVELYGDPRGEPENLLASALLPGSLDAWREVLLGRVLRRPKVACLTLSPAGPMRRAAREREIPYSLCQDRERADAESASAAHVHAAWPSLLRRLDAMREDAQRLARQIKPHLPRLEWVSAVHL